jgi:hypothetical protein
VKGREQASRQNKAERWLWDGVPETVFFVTRRHIRFLTANEVIE